MLVAGITLNIIGSALLFYWAFCFTLRSTGDVDFIISHAPKLIWHKLLYSDKFRGIAMRAGEAGFLILLVGFVLQLIHVLCN